MAAITKGVYVVAAKRTAFGKFGGALKNIKIADLQTVASKAALQAANIDPQHVDAVCIGNIIASSDSNGPLMPRHVSLNCGIGIEKPALGVNRLCGSGFQSIVSAAHDILMGTANIVLTGGVENMSQVPYVVRDIRFGTTLGKHFEMEDLLWNSLIDNYLKLPLGVTAENLAVQYKITRERADEFSYRSHQNWHNAQTAGVFNDEIAPTIVKVKGKEIEFTIDELPKPSTTLEALGKLPTVFKKNGTVTAGSSSGIGDGASAVVVVSEAALKEHNLKPLARLVGYSTVGVKPEIMGIGPVPAIQNLLKVSGKSLNDIGLVEINEAFASQALACSDALDLDPNIYNVHGGAIAMGHPLGCSGSRICAHLVHAMRQKNIKYSIGSACAAGGQGIALLFESC